MQQISYWYTPSSHPFDNPLLRAVAHGLAQLMPVTECETWPPPLLEPLARLEDPLSADTEAPPLVMVVGRCPTMVEQEATLLRASNLEVICCDGGEAAVAVIKCRAGDVALVVADQRLDGAMDGFGLARAFGLLWPGVPVIPTAESCPREPLPIAVTPLRKPWLPLSLLVEAHRVLKVSPPSRTDPPQTGTAATHQCFQPRAQNCHERLTVTPAAIHDLDLVSIGAEHIAERVYDLDGSIAGGHPPPGKYDSACRSRSCLLDHAAPRFAGYDVLRLGEAILCHVVCQADGTATTHQQ